jgi:Flp pilus assembly protein TadD
MSTEQEPQALRDLADGLASEGRYEEAVEIYNRLVRDDPGSDSLLMSLAWAYRDWGKEEEAVGCLETLFEREIRRRVFTGFAFDEMVRLFREKGMHDRAVSLCERVAEAQPEDPALLCTLGEAYLRAGRGDRAVGVFLKLAEMEPEASAYLCLLGNAYALAGDPEKAVESYEKAAVLEPGKSHVFFCRLGNQFARSGNLEWGERILRRAIGEKPDDPLSHCSLGDVLIRLGRIDEAQKAYDRAIALDGPSREGYLNRMGKSLLEEGRTGEAAAVFEVLCSLSPGNPIHRRNLEEARSLMKP